MKDIIIGFLIGCLVGLAFLLIFIERIPEFVVKRIAKYLKYQLPKINPVTNEIIKALLNELFLKGRAINQQSLEILEQCQALIRQTDYDHDKNKLLEMLSKDRPEEFQMIIPRSLQNVLDVTYTIETRTYTHLFQKVKQHAEVLAKFRHYDRLANILRREILKRSF